MSSLKERLTEIRDALGSNAELARAAGVSRANVTLWMAGDAESLRADAAINIEDRTGYSARWVALGKGPKRIDAKGTHAAQPTPIYDVDTEIRESPADAQKLLLIVRTFLETDATGRDAILAGAKVALRRHRTARQKRVGAAAANTG